MSGHVISHLVRMVNWKVGSQRPSAAEALDVIVGGSSAQVVCVLEMEVSLDADKSAAQIALDAGMEYKMLVEHQTVFPKYKVYFSVLVSSADGTNTWETVGDLERFGTSTKKNHEHKCVHCQGIKLSGRPLRIFFLGVNLDPSLDAISTQLVDLQEWLSKRTDCDVVTACGDFNIRLHRPPWAECDEELQKDGKKKSILTQKAVKEIVMKLQTAEGRLELLKFDPMEHSAETTVPQVKQLCDMLVFPSFGGGLDPGMPTYKRTPGVSIVEDDLEVLDHVYFQMMEGDTELPAQRYIKESGGAPFLQLGWLDRAAFRAPPGDISVSMPLHKALDAPTMSDHAPTVSEFRIDIKQVKAVACRIL